MTTGIYKITNKINGKVYIGQSDNCERRIAEHKKKRTVPIDMWINMIGVENFDFEIIEECEKSELDQKEKDYIDQYNSKYAGYNIQQGGLNNTAGESNGRALITEDDVKVIRRAYNEHKTQKEIYELFKDKITFSQFQAIWQGRSWSYVMPEVFTSENKEYYVKHFAKEKASLTKEEVLNYRTYYVDHTADETYEKLCQEKGKDFLKRRTFQKILTGDVRKTSYYIDVPVYSKSRKQWEIKGNLVSTKLESEL